jgi:peroxiredoxin
MQTLKTLTLGAAAFALAGLAIALPVVEEPKPKEEPKPAEELKAEVGKAAPAFELKDLDGKTVKLADFKDKIVVLEWFDPTCPMCVWAYGENGPLRTLPAQLEKEGVIWLAVNSANPEAGGSDVKKNQEFLAKNKVKARVLLDPKGDVGRTYGAKTTPHVYVIDAKGVLAYMGALDNAPLGKADGDTRIDYVTEAVKALKENKKPAVTETKSYG